MNDEMGFGAISLMDTKKKCLGARNSITGGRSLFETWLSGESKYGRNVIIGCGDLRLEMMLVFLYFWFDLGSSASLSLSLSLCCLSLTVRILVGRPVAMPTQHQGES